MTDHSRRRSRRHDDTVVPLLMGALVVATVGPAALTAAKNWLLPRSAAVGLTFAEWWNRNWWLVAFWVLELLILIAYLWWLSRRNRLRQAQLESVTAGLARVLPSDWDPERHLKVQRWQGYRPVRLRLLLTPRSPIADRHWQHSVDRALDSVLGRIEPLSWPTTPPGRVIAWGVRLPRLDVRVQTGPRPTEDAAGDDNDTELDEIGIPADLPVHRRPQQR